MALHRLLSFALTTAVMCSAVAHEVQGFGTKFGAQGLAPAIARAGAKVSLCASARGFIYGARNALTYKILDTYPCRFTSARLSSPSQGVL